MIDSVRFVPKTWNPPGPVEVVATLSDGSEVTLFSYYSDELRFAPEDLVGHTVEEARALHHQRDRQGMDS